MVCSIHENCPFLPSVKCRSDCIDVFYAQNLYCILIHSFQIEYKVIVFEEKIRCLKPKIEFV